MDKLHYKEMVSALNGLEEEKSIVKKSRKKTKNVE